MDLPPGDSVGEMATFNGGLIAAGLRRDPGGGQEDGIVWTSPDGLSWQQAELFEHRSVESVAASPDAVVVVGQDLYYDNWARSWAWYSSDGESWTRAQLPGPKGTNVRAWSVGWGSSGFVVVGGFDTGELGRDGALAWYSPDGRLWSKASLKGRPPTGFGDVVYTDGGYLATAYDRLWTSKDGHAWKKGVATADVFSGRITVGNGWLVVWEFDSDGRIAVSRDGLDWQSVKLPGMYRVDDVVATSGGFVALGAGAVDDNASTEFQVFDTAQGDPLTWVQEPDRPDFHNYAPPPAPDELGEPIVASHLGIVPGQDRVVAIGPGIEFMGEAPS